MSWIQDMRNRLADRFIRHASEDRLRIEAAMRSNNALSGQITLEGRQMIPQAFREWKNALVYASDPERPDRSALLDVYEALRRDGHLMAVVDSRVLRVQRAEFSILDANGEPTELHTLLDAGWFEDFIRVAMMSVFEGTKVVELFHLDAEGRLTTATPIPMSHVIPQRGIITKEAGDEKGWPYKEGRLAAYYIQIGSDRDLGLFSDIAPLVLSKTIARGGWLSFIDKFGTPPVVVTSEDRTLERQNKLLAMLKNLTSSHYGVLQGGEELQVLANTQTDAHDVFNEFIERCNSEMSKRVLGATGTVDEKAFVGSAQVHQDTAAYRHESDKLFVQRLVNAELLPRLSQLSPYYAPLAGHTFAYDTSDEMSRVEIIDAVAKLGGLYEMDLEILAEKTGLPIIAKKTAEPDGGKGKSEPPGKVEGGTGRPLVSAHYEDCGCGEDHGHGVQALNLSGWNALIDRIADDLHKGKLKPADLDADLIKKTADELAVAQGKGWGKDWADMDYDSTDWETNRKLRANLYRFSGAKTWQQLNDMHAALFDKDGKIRLFEDFKKDVLAIHQTYNRNHLDAEYSTALKAAQHAKDWQGFVEDADLFPNLRYRTVGDDRVRQSHDALDGIVRPVGDEFWDSYYPPNGWRCRCYVEQTDEPASGEVEDDLDIKDEFLYNLGNDKRIFSKKHKYFAIPKGDKDVVMQSFAKMVDADHFYTLVKAYKNGGRLEVHPLNNEPENIATGRLLALKGYKVKVRPHIENDGSQPDMWLDGELSEVKRPTTLNALNKRIADASKQGAKSAVVYVGPLGRKELVGQLESTLNPTKNRGISYVVLIRDGRAVKISRAEIIAKRVDKYLDGLYK